MKERMKTVSVALVLCLNVGVDPPDVVKIQPCARLECWIDPSSVAPQKALELIGANLQRQYERWQPRARYKQSLDPTVEDVKKLCTSLRRNAKEERVLFHYNGHGVPRPTVNGEIWVFNKTYTQYIPLSIYDLQKWMGAPSIYVYDCSNAGIIVNSFHTFAETHEKEAEIHKSTAGSTANPSEPADPNRGESPTPTVTTYKNCIQLAACSENQILPMNPQLPADLFTACLTTPIKIAIKWYTLQTKTKLLPHVSEENIDKIPGMLNDRRTMLGELNWIFTAITDTIAWNTLPKELFQRLFRQDLLVASLFRNFLLAERILKSYDCTPVSSPALPQCYRHPMWLAWDLALDMALTQLPDILHKDNPKPYEHSSFFEEQLTAFQVWLEESIKERSPPEQLPIVLQVLLSQVHRLRALELLGHFLDLGPWAVNLALSVGIFPYVLKLLQSSAKELRPILVFIWAKILAVDASRQVDIIRDQGHKFFLSALQETAASSTFFKGDHRVYAAFVLASIVHNFPLGQTTALQGQLLSICLVQIDDENPLLRQWLAITLGHLWQNNEQAKWCGVRDLANEKLFFLLRDPVPEVRAAAVYALGTFISSVVMRTEHADNIDRLTAMELLTAAINDMSPVVRMELVAALQWMVVMFETHIINIFLQELNKEQHGGTTNSYHRHTSSLERQFKMPRVSSSNSVMNVGKNSFNSVYLKLWNGLIALSRDPHPGVAEKAMKIVDYLKNQGIITIQAQEATSEKIGTSISLPPSPNTRLINYLGESPPAHSLHLHAHNTPLASKHKFSQLNKSGELMQNKDHSDQQSTATGSSSSQRQESQPPALKSIITTSYIEDSVAYFARPSKLKKGADGNANNLNSSDYLDQQPAWIRCQIAQDEGRQQQRRADLYGRLNTQIWSCRTNHTPTLVKLHPFDNQIAVAYKDRVMLHDWTLDIKSAFIPEIIHPTFIDQKPHHPPPITVSSLEFVNVKDGGVLVMAGYSDSSIRLWRPGDGTNEAALVTAWQGLLDFYTPLTSKILTEVGLVTAWHQQSQTIMAAGESKYIRLWDAEHESKICDIPTGSDMAVTKLSCAPNGIFAAGCIDGTVRLFDKRCSPTEARFTTFREHLNSILTICLRDDCEYLISACTTCSVKLFDIRKNNGSYHTWNAGPDVTAMSIHTSADIIACASSSITIHGMDGTNLSTIRCNEGFMGTKYGLTSCLSFHRYKINLAAGFVNNSACVFATDRK